MEAEGALGRAFGGNLTKQPNVLDRRALVPEYSANLNFHRDQLYELGEYSNSLHLGQNLGLYLDLKIPIFSGEVRFRGGHCIRSQGGAWVCWSSERAQEGQL